MHCTSILSKNVANNVKKPVSLTKIRRYVVEIDESSRGRGIDDVRTRGYLGYRKLLILGIKFKQLTNLNNLLYVFKN